jgi:hypothetical protein
VATLQACGVTRLQACGVTRLQVCRVMRLLGEGGRRRVPVTPDLIGCL